jgi:hypothetical protein
MTLDFENDFLADLHLLLLDATIDAVPLKP